MQFDDLAPASRARMCQVANPVADTFLATDNPAIIRVCTDELTPIHRG